jgi:hypothetical protein
VAVGELVAVSDGTAFVSDGRGESVKDVAESSTAMFTAPESGSSARSLPKIAARRITVPNSAPAATRNVFFRARGSGSEFGCRGCGASNW